MTSKAKQAAVILAVAWPLAIFVIDPSYARARVRPTPDPGAALFLRKGCVACHSLDTDPDAVGTLGPDLSAIGQQMPEARIRAIIADPRSESATTSMPELDLTARQVDLLARFIMATPPPAPTPTPFRPRPKPTSGF